MKDKKSKNAEAGYYSDADTLISHIEDLTEEQSFLYSQLRVTLKIQTIWPEAFDHGPVRFGGLQKHYKQPGHLGYQQAFIEAWFINNHTQRWLTPEELVCLKPEAIAHSEYVVHDERRCGARGKVT